MVTDTADKTSFDLLLVTLPDTVVEDCANATVEVRANNTNATHKRCSCFIMAIYVKKKKTN
jgi:hypothetical protein